MITNNSPLMITNNSPQRRRERRVTQRFLWFKECRELPAGGVGVSPNFLFHKEEVQGSAPAGGLGYPQLL
jgi:hypothetical protein